MQMEKILCTRILGVILLVIAVQASYSKGAPNNVVRAKREYYTRPEDSVQTPAPPVFLKPTIWPPKLRTRQLGGKPEVRSLGTAPWVAGHGVAGTIDDTYVPSRIPVPRYQDSNLFEDEGSRPTVAPISFRRIDVPPMSPSEMRNLPSTVWVTPARQGLETKSLYPDDDDDYDDEYSTRDGAKVAVGTRSHRYYGTHRPLPYTDPANKHYLANEKWYTYWPSYKNQLRKKGQTFVSTTGLIRQAGAYN